MPPMPPSSRPASTPLSRPALIAVSAFGALSLLGGWLIVLSGGFHSATARHDPSTVFVGGAPAVVMALLQFSAAAIALTGVLRTRTSTVAATFGAVGLVFVPPAGYLLLA